MLRFMPVIILAGFFLEIASIIWVGQVLGVLMTLLLIVAGGVLGIALFRKTGLTVAAALRAPIQNSSDHRQLVGTTAFGTLAGLLFMVPGFFSDVVALLLLLPPVQEWLTARMKIASVSTGDSQSRPRGRFETVIESEAVEIEGEIMPPERDGR